MASATMSIISNPLYVSYLHKLNGYIPSLSLFSLYFRDSGTLRCLIQHLPSPGGSPLFCEIPLEFTLQVQSHVMQCCYWFCKRIESLEVYEKCDMMRQFLKSGCTTSVIYVWSVRLCSSLSQRLRSNASTYVLKMTVTQSHIPETCTGCSYPTL